jgi:hypothetical protein
VELKQIELRGLESRKRALQLAGVGRFELGGKEGLAGCAGREDVADDDLRLAIGRGGIDHSAAADERRDDVAGLAFAVRVGGVAESGRAESDRRNGFAAPRDRPGEQRRRGLSRGR